MWERELRKIKGLYDNRLRASQQKSSKMEQALTNQTYQVTSSWNFGNENVEKKTCHCTFSLLEMFYFILLKISIWCCHSILIKCMAFDKFVTFSNEFYITKPFHLYWISLDREINNKRLFFPIFLRILV